MSRWRDERSRTGQVAVLRNGGLPCWLVPDRAPKPLLFFTKMLCVAAWTRVSAADCRHAGSGQPELFAAVCCFWWWFRFNPRWTPASSQHAVIFFTARPTL